jgi:hypothetical protein
VWHTGKVVVELDGGQHAEEQCAYDERRTNWLKSQGYKVLRFWNNDVLRSTAAVCEVILAEANEAMSRTLLPPPLTPPHKGEGKSAPSNPSPLWGGSAPPDLIGGRRGGAREAQTARARKQ